MNDEIERLKSQIDRERAEEQRNVEQMRTWIEAHEEACSGFLSFIFNRSAMRQASERMQHYANVANVHQARANELQEKLWELEK